MEILRFNKDNRKEYRYFIKLYNNLQEFKILNINNFDVGEKEIFLIIEKGILKKYKIIGYSIIERDLKYLYMLNLISQEYKNDGTYIYISDFMVKTKLRNKGIGTRFAKYLMDEIFIDKNIIIQPDGDGYWFWKKFDFKHDNISKQETWIRLKRGLEEGKYEVYKE